MEAGSKEDFHHYRMEAEDARHVRLPVIEIPLPPLLLTRAADKAVVSDDWEQAKSYTPDDGFASSAAMKAIFDEDLRVRQPGLKLDWAAVKPADAVRRKQTTELLRKGGAAHRRRFSLGVVPVPARRQAGRLPDGTHFVAGRAE